MTPIPSLRAIKFACELAIAASLSVGPTCVRSEPAGAIIATTVTAAMIARACQAPRDLLSVDFCFGYVAATFDEMSLDGRICPSAGVTTEQVVAVAKKHLADHPELWDQHPLHVVGLGFTEAFPCRKQ